MGLAVSSASGGSWWTHYSTASLTVCVFVCLCVCVLCVCLCVCVGSLEIELTALGNSKFQHCLVLLRLKVSEVAHYTHT